MGWIECLRGGDEHMWVGHFLCFHSCLMSIVYSWFYHLHRTPLLLSSFCNPYVRITSSLPSMVLPLDPRPIISLAHCAPYAGTIPHLFTFFFDWKEIIIVALDLTKCWLYKWRSFLGSIKRFFKCCKWKSLKGFNLTR